MVLADSYSAAKNGWPFLTALVREGDTWEETIVPESGIYHTVFLPGLQVRPAELLGPASVLRGFAGSELIIS